MDLYGILITTRASNCYLGFYFISNNFFLWFNEVVYLTLCKICQYGLSLIRLSPGNNKIVDSVLIQEIMDQRKHVFWHNLHSVKYIDEIKTIKHAISYQTTEN